MDSGQTQFAILTFGVEMLELDDAQALEGLSNARCDQPELAEILNDPHEEHRAEHLPGR